MRLLCNSLRRCRRDDGITIIELSVTIGLIAIVLVAVLSVLNATQTNMGRELSRSDSNDQLRQAFESLDREVRSGNVLYDPNGESYASGDVAPGMSLRIYTQTNSPTRGNQAWCVQWRITSSRQLQTRRWIPHWDDSIDQGAVLPWRIVATGITNRVEGIPAFAMGGTSRNLLNVRLRANNDPSSKKGATVEVLEAVSGRNTEFFPASTSCGAQTPDPALVNTDGTKVPPY